MSIRALLQEARDLDLFEKKKGVNSLKFPADCTQRDLLRAARVKGRIKHKGSHDTVIDPETGKVVTVIPRHNPTSGTCREILKRLKQAFG